MLSEQFWLITLLGGLSAFLLANGVTDLTQSAWDDILTLTTSEIAQWSEWAQNELSASIEAVNVMVKDVSRMVQANTWSSWIAAFALLYLIFDKRQDNKRNDEYQRQSLKTRIDLSTAFIELTKELKAKRMGADEET